jgi:hypothetical protein
LLHLAHCSRYRRRVEIREARTDDAAAVAALLGELG